MFFKDLLDETLPQVDITARDYADLYRSLVAKENVRPAGPVHPRLSIWGPFEARLQQPMSLSWARSMKALGPRAASRAMAQSPDAPSARLPSPEEKIGQSAHDFATLLEAPEVILTRAEKVDGVPAVPSRWLLRLKLCSTAWGPLTRSKPQNLGSAGRASVIASP